VARLRALGATVVDAPPGRLSPDLADAFDDGGERPAALANPRSDNNEGGRAADAKEQG
jgi:hypothetical protein